MNKQDKELVERVLQMQEKLATDLLTQERSNSAALNKLRVILAIMGVLVALLLAKCGFPELVKLML